VTSTLPFVNIPNYPELDKVMEELNKYPNVVAFDMEALAKEVASARTSNMVLLGAAAPFIELEEEKIEEGIKIVFGAKGENIVEMNIKAFRAGLQYTKDLLAKK
jgi:indolepyruvate ferredoxin oxidoreductase beta subunit